MSGTRRRRPLGWEGVILLSLVARTSRHHVAEGSNWAQVSGEQKQNVVVPYLPGAQRPHWTGRMGAAITMSNLTDRGEARLGATTRLIMLGGDDWISGKEGLPKESGGGFRNDVWYTESNIERWEVEETSAQHKLPIVKSKLEWIEVNSGETPPSGVTYDEWIQCQTNWGRPGLIGVSSVKEPANGWSCANLSEVPARYLSKNMWSPRRDHQAAMYEDVLFVLGGRAREHVDLDMCVRGGVALCGG